MAYNAQLLNHNKYDIINTMAYNGTALRETGQFATPFCAQCLKTDLWSVS